MAKIPYKQNAVYNIATPVYFRKGRIAKIARWLHKRIKSRTLYRLGYGEIEVPSEPQVIGFVESKNEDGTITVRLNPTAKSEWYTPPTPSSTAHEYGEKNGY